MDPIVTISASLVVLLLVSAWRYIFHEDDKYEYFEAFHENGKLFERGYRRASGAREGLYERFYASGERWEQSTYVNGVRHGRCQWWKPEQNEQATYHFIFGKRHGACVHKWGTVVKRWTCVQDKMHGRYVVTDGKVVLVDRVYDMDAIVSE